MEYEITIAGLKRKLPLCPIDEHTQIGAFIMFGDSELTEKAAAELLKLAPAFDVIATAEAKGIPLAHEMARQSGYADYIVMRKAPKLYMRDIISTEVDSITTDHIQTLCIGQSDADLMRNARVLVIDDVISTGESLRSMEKLILQVQGQIAGRMTVLAEGAAADREDIIYLEKLPLFDADGQPKD